MTKEEYCAADDSVMDAARMVEWAVKSEGLREWLVWAYDARGAKSAYLAFYGLGGRLGIKDMVWEKCEEVPDGNPA